ncbi:hypothetical protein [Tropicimonas sp. IMCC34043]|uniref:hypothetical protein n=1 Tax=Tropicimonas sp. IMCC34043 TaxID=2248760 RepID=UPI00130062F0|nr:hypothetical protein [Tropicimonas sp. IMCC34043]
MTETDHHGTPQESLTPFAGDRGWRGLARTEGEGVAYGIVAALVALILIVGFTAGIAGVLLIFVALTFLSLAILVIISYGG